MRWGLGFFLIGMGDFLWLAGGDDFDGEAFEVSGFGDGDEDGVVGALAVFADEAEGFFGVDGGVGEVFEEEFAGGVVGAAEGGEESAFIEEFEGAEVDFLIAAHGIGEGLFVAGEAGGIEDDEVVFGFGVFEEVEDVVFDDVDVESVDLGVVACGGAGGFGDVDGGDAGGTGFGAGEGEAALVGEAVEDAFALGEFGDFGVRFELVEVESGFLAVDEVDFEGEAVGDDVEGSGVFAVDDFDSGFHAFGAAGGGVVAEDDEGGGEDGNEGVADEIAPEVHGEGEGLDGEAVAVAVDDESRDAVGFAPDDAAEAIVDAAALAEFEGLGDAAGEEVEIEVLAAAGEAAGDDLGLGIVDGGAEGAIAEILECDDVAGLGIAEGFLDFSGVNPLVTVENASAWSDDKTGHGAGITPEWRWNVEPESWV